MDGPNLANAADRLSQQPEGHTEFVKVSTRNAKCDQCEKRNTTVMQKCTKCGMTTCSFCYESGRFDRRHQLADLDLDWTVEVKRRPKFKGNTGSREDAGDSPAQSKRSSSSKRGRPSAPHRAVVGRDSSARGLVRETLGHKSPQTLQSIGAAPGAIGERSETLDSPIGDEIRVRPVAFKPDDNTHEPEQEYPFQALGRLPNGRTPLPPGRLPPISQIIAGQPIRSTASANSRQATPYRRHSGPVPRGPDSSLRAVGSSSTPIRSARTSSDTRGVGELESGDLAYNLALAPPQRRARWVRVWPPQNPKLYTCEVQFMDDFRRCVELLLAKGPHLLAHVDPRNNAQRPRLGSLNTIDLRGTRQQWKFLIELHKTWSGDAIIRTERGRNGRLVALEMLEASASLEAIRQDMPQNSLWKYWFLLMRSDLAHVLQRRIA